MSKDEVSKKAGLRKQIIEELPNFVYLGIQDVRNAGIPDICLTGNRRTSWWELKHGTPDFKSPGIQELECCKLAEQGFCWYVIYLENELGKSTHIFEPKDILGSKGKFKNIDWSKHVYSDVGYNHKAVVDFMKSVHGVRS